MGTQIAAEQRQHAAGQVGASTAVEGSHTSGSGGVPAASQLPLEVQQALLPKVVVSFQHPFGPWRRRYMVGLVSVITALLCADQNLLAPNLSAAAAYFGLDDGQKDTYLGGYLMAAFFIVGAPAALACGYLADKYNRVRLLVTVVIVGEAPCLATYWVSQLWQFFLLRMLTGIAVGGCFPLVFSLLGDLFPVNQRSAMSALVQIAVGAGIGGGQMLAGIIGPATNWRVPFAVVAVPSLLLALLLLFTVREPPRGGMEEALAGQLAAGAAYSETISLHKLKRILAVPSNWIIILQGLFGCLPWGVMQTYINDYLHLNKGYTVEMSTVIILLFGIGCGAGVIVGGAAGQLLYNWRKEAMAVLTGLSVLAGAGPVYFLINADLQARGFAASLAMSALAGALVSIAGPNLRAIMINVNTPSTRGVSIALQSVTDDLGRGLGPVIVAGFISQLGRQTAFNVAVAGWVPCGLLLCCLVFTMRKDEENMQRQLELQANAALEQIRVTSGGGGADPDKGSSPTSDSIVEGCELMPLGGKTAAAALAAEGGAMKQGVPELAAAAAANRVGAGEQLFRQKCGSGSGESSWPGSGSLAASSDLRGRGLLKGSAAVIDGSPAGPDAELATAGVVVQLSDCPASSADSGCSSLQDGSGVFAAERSSSTQQLLQPERLHVDSSAGKAAVCSSTSVQLWHKGIHFRHTGRGSGNGSSSGSSNPGPHSRAGSGGVPVAEGHESGQQQPGAAMVPGAMSESETV